MSDYCTIFARGTDVAAVQDRVRASSPQPIEVHGPADAWDRLVVRAAGATLTLNALRYVRGGDQCSKTLLGAINFFRRVQTPAVASRERITAHLGACRLVIGVVGDPGFTEESGFDGVIMDVAKTLDGMIFNGTAMYDATGVLLLDRDGSSEAKAA